MPAQTASTPTGGTTTHPHRPGRGALVLDPEVASVPFVPNEALALETNQAGDSPLDPLVGHTLMLGWQSSTLPSHDRTSGRARQSAHPERHCWSGRQASVIRPRRWRRRNTRACRPRGHSSDTVEAYASSCRGRLPASVDHRPSKRTCDCSTTWQSTAAGAHPRLVWWIASVTQCARKLEVRIEQLIQRNLVVACGCGSSRRVGRSPRPFRTPAC